MTIAKARSHWISVVNMAPNDSVTQRFFRIYIFDIGYVWRHQCVDAHCCRLAYFTKSCYFSTKFFICPKHFLRPALLVPLKILKSVDNSSVCELWLSLDKLWTVLCNVRGKLMPCLNHDEDIQIMVGDRISNHVVFSAKTPGIPRSKPQSSILRCTNSNRIHPKQHRCMYRVIKLNRRSLNNRRYTVDTGLLTINRIEHQKLKNITAQIDEASRLFGLIINAEKS